MRQQRVLIQEHDRDAPADHVGNGGGAALVRHMHQVDLGVLLQHFHGQVTRRAAARAGMRVLTRVLARQLDEVGKGLAGKLHVGDQHVGPGGQQRDMREVAVPIRHVLVDGVADGVGAHPRQQQGVAVRFGLGHHIGTDVAVGPALVFDDDALAQLFGKFGREQPAHRVGAAAGRERHDQLDRLRWPVAGLRHGCRGQQRQGAKGGRSEHGKASARQGFGLLHGCLFRMVFLRV
ncbi:hypothetical protein D3C73_1020490 [compost metagenome]